MVLDRLHDELKIEALQHGYCLRPLYCRRSIIDRKKNWRDLANVALCSRHYHTLATPILYSSLPTWRVASFLPTILCKPELARYVQHVIGNYISSLRYDCEPVQDAWEHERYHDAIRVFWVGIQNLLEKGCVDNSLRCRWLETIFDDSGAILGWTPDAGSWDSVWAILLLLFPNLSSFYMNEYTEGLDPDLHNDEEMPGKLEFIPFVVAQAAKLQLSGMASEYSLSNLRRVKIRMHPNSELVSPISLRPLFQLPSIRHVFLPSAIEAGHTVDINNGENDTPNTPLSQATHLQMPLADLHSRTLARFLNGFGHLTHLTYMHGDYREYCNHASLGGQPFIPATIHASLLHLKSSLQELTLRDDRDDYLLTRPEECPVAPLGSLIEFRCLRRLDVTACVLLGRGDCAPEEILPAEYAASALRLFAEGLPESLERLGLRSCVRHVYAAVEMLLDRRRMGGLRRLRCLELSFQNRFTLEEVLAFEQGEKCVVLGGELGLRIERGVDGERLVAVPEV